MTRRGVALFLAILAIVLIGALVAGTWFAGRLEQQSGQSAFAVLQAAEAAEAGLNDALANGPAATYVALPVGGTAALGTLALGDGASSTRAVRRLTGTLFLLQALGERRTPAGAEVARDSLGLLIRLSPAGAPARVVERSWVRLY